jgi:hypothetical protein
MVICYSCIDVVFNVFFFFNEIMCPYMFIVSEFNLKISEHDCIVGLIEIIIYLCMYLIFYKNNNYKLLYFDSLFSITCICNRNQSRPTNFT